MILNTDQKRLAHLAQLLDGINGVDFHEQAFSAAVSNGREEANESDYYYAVCLAIDTQYCKEGCVLMEPHEECAVVNT